MPTARAFVVEVETREPPLLGVAAVERRRFFLPFAARHSPAGHSLPAVIDAGSPDDGGRRTRRPDLLTTSRVRFDASGFKARSPRPLSPPERPASPSRVGRRSSIGILRLEAIASLPKLRSAPRVHTQWRLVGAPQPPGKAVVSLRPAVFGLVVAAAFARRVSMPISGQPARAIPPMQPGCQRTGLHHHATERQTQPLRGMAQSIWRTLRPDLVHDLPGHSEHTNRGVVTRAQRRNRRADQPAVSVQLPRRARPGPKVPLSIICWSKAAASCPARAGTGSVRAGGD